jgi:site-specific DNA-cytosine methylase
LPGFVLPSFPEPTHTQSPTTESNLATTPTVEEALAGLPALSVDTTREEVWLGPLAASCKRKQPYLAWCRGSESYVRNHSWAGVSERAYAVTPRLDPGKPCGTVLTKPSPRWACRHPTQPERYVSPREAARLQSFPDSLQLRGSQAAQYKQVGNAVPVRLAECLGHEIVSALRNASESTAK